MCPIFIKKWKSIFVAIVTTLYLVASFCHCIVELYLEDFHTKKEANPNLIQWVIIKDTPKTLNLIRHIRLCQSNAFKTN